LSKAEELAIRNLLKKWLVKLDLRHAHMHFEARCRPQSLYNEKPVLDENQNLIDENYFFMPIEMNLRLGGGETWSMIKAVFDVDLFKACLDLALGFDLTKSELTTKNDTPRCTCISKDVHSAGRTLLKSVSVNLTKLQGDQSVVEALFFKYPGEALSYDDYIAHFVVKTGENESQFYSLDRAMDYVRFDS
jgi:biotin carboxylase